MTTTAAWLALLVAGLLEVCWAIGLKYSHGFSRLVPTALTVACMAGSFALLSWSLKSLPVSIAYVVWVGIGAAGTAIVGMVVLGEPATAARVACLALIVTGVVGLKLATP